MTTTDQKHMATTDRALLPIRAKALRSPVAHELVDQAIRQGNLPALIWAHGNGYVFNPTDCGVAARSHQLGVLKWMRETEAKKPGQGVFVPCIAARELLHPCWYSHGGAFRDINATMHDPATAAKIMHWLQGNHAVLKSLRMIPHHHYNSDMLSAHQWLMEELRAKQEADVKMNVPMAARGTPIPPTFVPLRARL